MEDWQESIQRVLSGESQLVAVELAPLNTYITYISESIGAIYDYEGNGFEVDYSAWWFKEGKKYTLTGDLWYNEQITFQVIDKKDW